MADKNPDDPEMILEEISQILWPDGDVDFQWSPDTLDAVAFALISRGYCPRELKERD